MKLGYRLSKLCGNVFENGNLVFTADGNSLISPVGNRVTIVDLINHSSTSLPMENTKNIRRVAVSHNSRFLVSVDVDGHALFINLPKRVVLQRFHFKAKVHDIKFSPDDEYFAVTFGHGCQIWRTPSVTHEFAPLVLCRTLSGHKGDVECLDWSADSQSIIMGSRDMSARVYYRVHSKNMAMTNLTGHRDVLRGVFFDESGDQAFTVASDCAVFCWRFEYGDRIVKSAEGEQLITKRGGSWKLEARHFLWEPHVSITSVAFNKSSNLLVVGFSGGVFGLYEMPECRNLHKLSVSNFSLNAACINPSGEWLALGSSRLGQLLVWEWQSETYVLKQQGHLYGMNALDFSSDGHYVATGGDDGKVKLWSMSTGFCFATFAEHTAPITGVKFIGKAAGKAIVSCSLDGTVRAHDLLRYKNFRTLTTPTPVQFNCLAVDSSGEIVCAGSLDPFNIYVWSIHTGRLLDVLAGHEGPVACLRFAEGSGVLASGSWDGTLKLWDVYSNTCSETMEHGCDVLALCFRPDGKVVCTATTNGNLTFWDVENGTQLSTIEGRRDITGGRHTTDRVTADNSVRSKFFTTVAFSADGSCVLAGGKSKYVCIYNVASGTLVKKFQLSHNRSLEGVLDELRSDQLVDGVAMGNLVTRGAISGLNDPDDDHFAKSMLPGASGKSQNDGSRNTRPDIRTSAVAFSSTGREWAAATTQGLQIFALDDGALFAPTELDTAITPQEIDKAIACDEYGRAINMALCLGDHTCIKKAVDSVHPDAIDFVQKSIDLRSLHILMKFLAEEITKSRHIQFYLQWCSSIVKTHSSTLLAAGAAGSSMAYQESLRSLIRAVSTHEKEIMTACDSNQFQLCFLTQTGDRKVHSNDVPDLSSTPVDEEKEGALVTQSEDIASSAGSKRSRTAGKKNSQDIKDAEAEGKKRKTRS